MWMVSRSDAGFNIATIGLMLTGRPLTTSNPVGAFIQEFANTMNTAERTQKDRLGEEGRTLEREGHTNDPTGILHKLRPEQSQFKRGDRPRDSSHGE